jgi:hypothetical protein
MKICRIDNCERNAIAKQLCNAHYQQLRKGKEPGVLREVQKNSGSCKWESCNRKAIAKGYCDNHYQQLRRGEDLRDLREVNSPEWGSGRIVGGYHHIYRPDHPNANGDGYVATNRFVMSEHLGRALLSQETVHHKDLNKLNNDIDNLELWASIHPKGARVSDLVEYAESLLRLYAPEKLI